MHAIGPLRLGVLVERKHEVVAKQDIVDPERTDLLVAQCSLATQISAIRRALAQSPDGEGWIETLARRGYRLVGPVTEIAPGSTRSHKTCRPARSGPREWERGRVALLRVACCAWLPAWPAVGGQERDRHLAVSPFAGFHGLWLRHAAFRRHIGFADMSLRRKPRTLAPLRRDGRRKCSDQK